MPKPVPQFTEHGNVGIVQVTKTKCVLGRVYVICVSNLQESTLAMEFSTQVGTLLAVL